MVKKAEKNKNILLFDSNYICHMSKYKLKDLSYDEQSTGVIFHFLRSIILLAEKFNTNRFVFCWDSRRSKRKEIYPGYKDRIPKDRTDEDIELDKSMQRQASLLRTEIFGDLGFRNILIQSRYESDDILAAIVKNIKRDENYVIIGSDNDLWQVLCNCSMYDPKTKKTITRKSFVEDWGIEPEIWARVKCLAGCSTDTVSGIEGVGNVTAVKFIKGELKPHTKKYLEITSKAGRKIESRNKELVVLPIQGTKIPVLDFDEDFKIDDFIYICETYGFRSLLVGKSLKKWKEIFCNEI